MFDQIFKSLEVRQKYTATRRIFNSLLDFSIYQTRTTVFDIFNCQNATSSPKNKRISNGPYNYNFKCRREIKNIILLFIFNIPIYSIVMSLDSFSNFSFMKLRSAVLKISLRTGPHIPRSHIPYTTVNISSPPSQFKLVIP